MSELTPADALLRFRQQQAENVADGACAALVGDSPAMVQLRAQVAAAATSGASVLIEGNDAPPMHEVARAIHYARHSTGESSLWNIDAAAALPSELGRILEAMLRSDDAGSLIIESVNCLQAEQQLQLLTALGQTAWNAQLIATQPAVTSSNSATHGLSDELAAALATITINFPSLADRPEDIPTLIQWLLVQLDRESEADASNIADEALDVMMIYPWPAGQEELAEVVSKAHVKARGKTIGLHHLPKILGHAVDQAALAVDRPEPIDLDAYLSRVESALVERALELAAGNKAEAARLLGVSRPRLYRKLEQMGVAHTVVSTKPADSEQSAAPPTSDEPDPSTTATSDDGTPASGDGIEFLPVDGEELD